MNFLEIFKKIRQQFVDLWERTDKKDRIRFFMIAGVALVVIFAAVLLLTQTDYAVLYSGMDTTSAAEVTTELTAQGVPYKLTDGGATVMVPAKRLDEINMTLVSRGIPQQGGNYDMFAKGSGLTTSDYEKRKYAEFELSERLARGIAKIEGVVRASVILAIPEKQYTAVFANEMTDVTASVILTTDRGFEPDRGIVTTIQELVARGVPGLKPENVMVTDGTGVLLSTDKEDAYTSLESTYQFKRRFEFDLANDVLLLLRPMVGYDKVKAIVNADLDMDDHAIQNTIFGPVVDQDGIAISMQSITETANGPVSVAGEPGTDLNGGTDQYTTTTGEGSTYKKITNNVNYEVNKTLEQITKAKGSVNSVHISVVIDSNDLNATNNNADTIKAIVGGVLGLDKAQYNNITVAFQPFDMAKQDADALAKYEADKRRAELFELIKTLALFVIIGVCMALLILKTFDLFRKKISDAEQTALDALANIEGEIDEYGELVKLATAGEQIEITKSPTRERVEEFIENNPDAVANLLRNWLSDEGKERRR